MEKIMHKTSDATHERELTEDHHPLADSELDAVSGGSDSGAYQGRYQLRLSEADKLLSAQGS